MKNIEKKIIFLLLILILEALSITQSFAETQDELKDIFATREEVFDWLNGDNTNIGINEAIDNIESNIRNQVRKRVQAQFSARIGKSGGNKEESVSLTDWVKEIPDNRYINNINFPGTHDSATVFVYNSNALVMTQKEYARCQSLTISDQLNNGIRVFDLRIDGSDTNGNLCHGSGMTKFIAKETADTNSSSTVTFASVFNVMKSFLDSHDKETILISVKTEDGNASNVITAINNVINSNSSYFYTGSSIPKLSQVRKKIVILSRISSFTSGIALNVPDNTSGNVSIDGIDVFIEDHYDATATEKKEYIDAAFASTSVHNVNVDGTKGDTGSIIFTSSNIALSATPLQIANEVNPHIKSKTFDKGKLLGWILSDFVDAEIARKIIDTNP